MFGCRIARQLSWISVAVSTLPISYFADKAVYPGTFAVRYLDKSNIGNSDTSHLSVVTFEDIDKDSLLEYFWLFGQEKQGLSQVEDAGHHRVSVFREELLHGVHVSLNALQFLS